MFVCLFVWLSVSRCLYVGGCQQSQLVNEDRAGQILSRASLLVFRIRLGPVNPHVSVIDY